MSRSERSPALSVGPRFRAPRPSFRPVRRERVTAAITAAVETDGVTVVSAPSGFGKTTAVAAWAAKRDDVVWLTLREADADAVRLAEDVLQALGLPDDEHGDASPNPLAPAAACSRICATLRSAGAPVHLVVDDAHRAGSAWRDGVLGMLAEWPPDGLRLLLVGAPPLHASLPRLRLTNPGAFVGADVLAFDRTEATRLSARAGLDGDALLAETGGWPIAIGAVVRATGTVDSTAALRGYISEHVLASLPRHLSEFVLDATVCTEITPQTAAVVAERDDAPELLESCVRLGIYLDRFEGAEGPLYRWHPVFARQCSELVRTDAPRFTALRTSRRAAAPSSAANASLRRS